MLNSKIFLPKYNEDKFSSYLKDKKLQCYIFDQMKDEDLDNPLYVDYLLSDEFFQSLVDFIGKNYKLEIADATIRDNIRNIIWYLRDNKKYDTKTENQELRRILNECIISLNKSRCTNDIGFYRQQFYYRSDQRPTSFWNQAYDENYISERKESLNFSISRDYDTIYGLSLLDSEEEFKEDVVPDKINCHYFINTLNVLFYECPSIYNIDKVVSRANYILEINKKLIKNKPCPYELNNDIEDELLYRTSKVMKKMKKINR